MIYCDASLLVALLVDEPHSDAVVRWFREQRAEDLFASDWTVTEVGSALALKLRLGHVDEPYHRRAVATAEELFAGLGMIVVETHHFTAAAKRHVLAPPAGLRAGDALHLAIVVDHRSALATLDRRFAEAAERSGVRVDPVVLDR